ncbi:hypothetical protein RchiOBHm_Chr1g0344591 [Rosa chinensis]|uniref:Uncharacterized protein n=1 Tax=Rosa chinensis TaxID=74649 RepID=A0A2P6SEL0_ROSCH|nr:hypothetical protein RchiOBHm_Chr1g0344591 [Rosa chinensis]
MLAVVFLGFYLRRTSQLIGGIAGVGFLILRRGLFGGDCIGFRTSEVGEVWMGDAGYGIASEAADSGCVHDRGQL